MTTYRFTYKNSLILFDNEFVQVVKTTNDYLTANEVFEKYMMATHRDYYMSGMITLVKVERI